MYISACQHRSTDCIIQSLWGWNFRTQRKHPRRSAEQPAVWGWGFLDSLSQATAAVAQCWHNLWHIPRTRPEGTTLKHFNRYLPLVCQQPNHSQLRTPFPLCCCFRSHFFSAFSSACSQLTSPMQCYPDTITQPWDLPCHLAHNLVRHGAAWSVV